MPPLFRDPRTVGVCSHMDSAPLLLTIRSTGMGASPLSLAQHGRGCATTSMPPHFGNPDTALVMVPKRGGVKVAASMWLQMQGYIATEAPLLFVDPEMALI